MKLRIEKTIYGGSGLARQTEGEGAGRTLFVPFTLPEESIEARVLEEKNGFGEGSLVQVLTASPDRVRPRCSHFGHCGGCSYQHAGYFAQVHIKTAILQETLERAGLKALPPIQTHLGEPWAYRNRIRLRVAELDSALRLGYNKRGSNDFLAIQECPVSAPLLWRAAEALLQLAAENTSAARWIRSAVEVEFFTTADEKKLQMIVFVRKSHPGFSAFCDQMQKLVPELIGGGSILSRPEGSRRARSTQDLENWGVEGLIYSTSDEDYWVSRGGFFQINRFLIDELIRIVATGRQGSLAWDLYAGVGLFSRALSRAFQQVVAVEAAATDLSRSFKGAGKRAVEATTVEFLRSAVVQRERPDLIVMDPPRAGVGAAVCTLIARLSAPEIVYVSCDPVTLARDLKDIVSAGYNIAELHLVDMFPQTFHLETVVVLRK